MMRAGPFFGILVLVSGLFPSLASATELPAGGMTVEEVQSWLQAAGYQAKIDKSPDGTLQGIISSSDGVKFVVWLNNCKNGRCTTLQFWLGYSESGSFDLAKENAWNSSRRWTSSYLDSSSHPNLKMDVDISPGGTLELLDDEFGIWRAALSDFNKLVNQ